MRNYDFDQIIDRRHSGSYKWDTPSQEGVIPMWVADMDFRTAPCIIEALRKRVDHGIFGYTKVPDKYYEALSGWFGRRYNWHIKPHDVIYTSGVVPAISAIIKGLTRPGDKVIVQTPAYNCFFSSIRNNGCILSANELLYGDDGRYTIDFDDLEQRAAQPQTKLMLLCNPHNPAGRVWDHSELMRIAETCRRHDVTVVADEIHCDLTYGKHRYTPFATVSKEIEQHCIVCNSPSKSFNTAGLQIANIVCADDAKRQLIDRAINDNEVCDVNPFGVAGLIAAYNEGEEWFDALRQYLWHNYQLACEYLSGTLRGFKITPLEGTYLMWINCVATGMDSEEICDYLERHGKVRLSPGSIYGKGGENFIRLNLACPEETLMEGLRRISEALSNLVKS